SLSSREMFNTSISVRRELTHGPARWSRVDSSTTENQETGDVVSVRRCRVSQSWYLAGSMDLSQLSIPFATLSESTQSSTAVIYHPLVQTHCCALQRSEGAVHGGKRQVSATLSSKVVRKGISPRA
ncbi:uncharacterized protein A4U43_C05F24560, partial [Asparagus officinalis]